MEEYLKRLKQKIDAMTDEEIMYVLVPELMFIRDEADMDGDTDKIKKIDEALAYIRERIDFKDFYMNLSEENVPIERFKRRKSKPRMPSPNEIIHGKPPKDIPNN